MGQVSVTTGDFASWLRGQLEDLEVSQRELGTASGVHHSTVSRILSRKREPLLASALRIVLALERCGCGRPRMDSVHASRCSPTCGYEIYRHHRFYTR